MDIGEVWILLKGAWWVPGTGVGLDRRPGSQLAGMWGWQIAFGVQRVPLVRLERFKGLCGS